MKTDEMVHVGYYDWVRATLTPPGEIPYDAEGQREFFKDHTAAFALPQMESRLSEFEHDLKRLGREGFPMLANQLAAAGPETASKLASEFVRSPQQAQGAEDALSLVGEREVTPPTDAPVLAVCSDITITGKTGT